MSEFLSNIDWNELIITIWTVILLPLLTYAGNEFRQWAKSKKIDKYTDILEKNVVNAVKDVHQTIVKYIKGTEGWDEETKEYVKEVAKQKAIHALSNSVYECLKTANTDFEEYIDSLVESSLFDIKNGLK